MPPRVKVTREQITEAALKAVRVGGEAALNARSIAALLGCSTQPIFSNFSSMEELRDEVLKAAEQLFTAKMEKEIASSEYPPYKASGMAYIDFASEEPELFTLLYMRERKSPEEDEDSSLSKTVMGMVKSGTGLEERDASLFHLEMWAFVHGIAVMSATGYLRTDRKLVSDMLTDAFQGLRHRHGGK